MRRLHTRTRHAILPVLGALAASCGASPEISHYDFPSLELSTEAVVFGTVELGESVTETLWLSNLGDLPLGITAIELGESDRSMQNFDLSWSLEDLECADITAAAKDSGWHDTDDPTTDDTATTQPPEDATTVLGKGCRLPLIVTFEPVEEGTLWGSIIVRTGNEYRTGGSVSVPLLFADPLHAKRMVTLSGEGERTSGDIRVEPRHHDFGHLWPGAVETVTIAIENSGDGDLTVAEPTLNDCPGSLEITDEGFDGLHTVLEPGVASFVEVSFTPENTGAVACTMFVESDDGDSPLTEVDLEANTGDNHDNVPPTVVIHSPGVGTQYADGDAGVLELRLNVFDLDQPADTLDCRVKSMVGADGASVADCHPPDESGDVTVEIPRESVDSGIDTLVARVMDASDVLAYASISVLWNTDFPSTDQDSDGWSPEVDDNGNADCDDLDDTTYPWAAEIVDGHDNDCDGLIDEGTQAYDDDGDSFSEDDGDCNDHDDGAYPGAWEIADYADNDCDGTIDEGTSLYDDDGDGYSEMDQDCDDADASVHPGAIEYCDGIDNDCNGLRDHADGCVETTTEPYVVGGIDLEQTACEPGDTIAASVFAYDADGQALDYSWTAEAGLVVVPLTGSPSVTITCPTPRDPGGSILSLSAYATDEDGNAAWALEELWIYPSGTLHRQYASRVSSQGSCATSGAVPVLSLAWLALVATAVQRRRGE
jgi:hypothetical protein